MTHIPHADRVGFPPPLEHKAFLAWLGAQSPGRRFDYSDCRGCMVAGFFEEVHGLKVAVGEDYYRPLLRPGSNPDTVPFPAWLSADLVAEGCRKGVGWTLRQLRAESSGHPTP